jgi:uncharacterized RDD family membrane protein YckC
LYETLNVIDGESNPEAFAALEAEIKSRTTASYAELTECWAVLKNRNWPEHEARLAGQIEAARIREGITAQSEDERLKYRTFWLRFFAALIDGLIIVVPLMVLAYVLKEFGLNTESVDEGTDFAIACLGLIYIVAMHAKFGQTVGKMVAEVKVVRVTDEGDIGLRESLLRSIVPILVVVITLAFWVTYFFLPSTLVITAFSYSMILVAILLQFWDLSEMITMLLNKKRRAIHDFIARTVVVRI